MTFEQLLDKSIEHAQAAEAFLDDPASIGAPEIPREDREAHAQVHAALAETYARLASAVIVNRTSLASVVESVGDAHPPITGGTTTRRPS